MKKKLITRKTAFEELLKTRGIKANELGKMLGYSEKSHIVYKWIYGQGEPNAATILKLMEILDVSALEILRAFAEGNE